MASAGETLATILGYTGGAAASIWGLQALKQPLSMKEAGGIALANGILALAVHQLFSKLLFPGVYKDLLTKQESSQTEINTLYSILNFSVSSLIILAVAPALKVNMLVHNFLAITIGGVATGTLCGHIFRTVETNRNTE